MKDDQNPRYYVLDGHTLGYVDNRFPNLFGVLHGSVILGGHDWKNGPVTLCSCHQLVDATRADFKRFRVMPPPGFP